MPIWYILTKIIYRLFNNYNITHVVRDGIGRVSNKVYQDLIKWLTIEGADPTGAGATDTAGAGGE